MRRNYFAEAAPLNAETFLDIRFVRLDNLGMICAKLWIGKSQKPKYVRFHTSEQRELWLEQQRAAAINRNQHKAKQQQDKKAAAVKTRQQYQVGQILCYSWGYDQTNVDYFQITERRGSVAMIRPIQSAFVEGTAGFMCQHVRPVRDAFTGPAIRKMVGPYGIAMPHGGASPVADDSTHYSSWYS